MTRRFQENMTVQDAVRQYPHGAFVLRRLGIATNETCALAEAALKERVPVELLMAALKKIALYVFSESGNFKALN